MIRNIIIPSYPYSNQNADTLSPEVQKKVLDAFEVFDHEQNKTVDAREIGTIIRSLGKYVLKQRFVWGPLMTPSRNTNFLNT